MPFCKVRRASLRSMATIWITCVCDSGCLGTVIKIQGERNSRILVPTLEGDRNLTYPQRATSTRCCRVCGSSKYPNPILTAVLWPVVLAEESPTGACFTDAWKQEGTSAAYGAELSVVWLGITHKGIGFITFATYMITWQFYFNYNFFLTRQKLHIFYIHIYDCFFFFRFFSLIGYCKIFSKVPCAIQ